MEQSLITLTGGALLVAIVHTATGPDHYLPFIVLARVKKWTISQTIFWTVLCGLGHVGSSILLATVGIGAGWALHNLLYIEEVRGSLAGWLFLGVGLLYFLWGLYQARKNRVHQHFDIYEDSIYTYKHSHEGGVVLPQDRKKVTPWILFLLFVLGPCEPLIPMFFLPAVEHSTEGIVILIAVFTFFTLATMVVMVLLGYYGITKLFRSEKLEQYMHAIAGATIFICGVGIVFLNW